VYVDGIFSRRGGEITGNTAASDGSADGGGGCVSGIFTMRGGAITGNTASDDSAEGSAEGGGVFVSEIYIMSGGAITGNTAFAGGGVYVDDGTFTKKAGTISGDDVETGNTATSGYGHAVCLYESPKRRDTTADQDVTLYARGDYNSGTWTWTFNETSNGGVGDTEEHWEVGEQYPNPQWLSPGMPSPSSGM
jgi:hypothetical protein